MNLAMPRAPMTSFNIDTWLEAFRSRDMDRMLDAFADDAEIIAEGTDIRLGGKEKLRAYAEDALASVEDMDFDVLDAVHGDDGRSLAVLVRGHVEYGKDFEAFGEHFDARGKVIDLNAALFLTLDADGKITQLRRVRDNWPIMRAFGITGDEYDDMVARVKETLEAE